MVLSSRQMLFLILQRQLYSLDPDSSLQRLEYLMVTLLSLIQAESETNQFELNLHCEFHIKHCHTCVAGTCKTLKMDQ